MEGFSKHPYDHDVTMRTELRARRAHLATAWSPSSTAASLTITQRQRRSPSGKQTRAHAELARHRLGHAAAMSTLSAKPPAPSPRTRRRRPRREPTQRVVQVLRVDPPPPPPPTPLPASLVQDEYAALAQAEAQDRAMWSAQFQASARARERSDRAAQSFASIENDLARWESQADVAAAVAWRQAEGLTDLRRTAYADATPPPPMAPFVAPLGGDALIHTPPIAAGALLFERAFVRGAAMHEGLCSIALGTAVAADRACLVVAFASKVKAGAWTSVRYSGKWSHAEPEATSVWPAAHPLARLATYDTQGRDLLAATSSPTYAATLPPNPSAAPPLVLEFDKVEVQLPGATVGGAPQRYFGSCVVKLIGNVTHGSLLNLTTARGAQVCAGLAPTFQLPVDSFMRAEPRAGGF